MKPGAITSGIIAVLILATVPMMPYLQATVRNNRIYLLGCVCLGVMAVLMLRHCLGAALLTGWVALSIFFSTSESCGSAMYQTLCLGGLYLGLMATRDYWELRRSWVYNALCALALINVGVQVLQMFGVSFPPGIKPYEHYGFPGLMGNVNETSVLLAMCLPFFFRRRWVWCIGFIVGGLFMARTTNGILAASIITVIWALLKAGRWEVKVSILAGLLGLGIFYCTLVDPLSLQKQQGSRGLVYKVTAQAATVKPLGWGLGQYDYVMPLLTHYGTIVQSGPQGQAYVEFLLSNVADKTALDRTVEKISGERDPVAMRSFLLSATHNTSAMFLQAHNEYLEAWFALGVPGLLFLLWQSLSRGYRRSDKIPALALTASALTAVFFFSWQIVPIAVVTVLCLVLTQSKE